MASNHSTPTLILGTALWGWTISEETAFELLDRFYEYGGREVDGATNYPINKIGADFRKSENILLEWIKANGVTDLKVMMKVGSMNNRGTPENNLSKSFLLMNLDDYKHRFQENLDTFMIHWDNRSNPSQIEATFEVLKVAKELDLSIGVSGVKHPDIYHLVNKNFGFNFRIQFKHNLLVSDYERYKPFHGTKKFITYGINVGGLKLNNTAYNNKSSLLARGRNAEMGSDLVPKLKELIQEQGLDKVVTTFNQCGMIYAAFHPDVSGILIGPSRVEQLESTFSFMAGLQDSKWGSFYDGLVEISEKLTNGAL